MENQKDSARRVAFAAAAVTVVVAAVAALALPPEATPMLALAIPFIGMTALDGVLARGRDARASA